MTGHFIISRLLEKASRSSVGHPYALGAGLDALGSRPHLFRAGLDALRLIRAVILLPGPGLDLLVLPDLFVPVVVGEAGLEQVVTVLLERGVVRAYGFFWGGMPWYAQFGCGGGGCDRIRYMKVVLQRVSQASVDVVNELGDLDPTFDLQQIGPGFLLLVGVTDEDGDDEIAWLAHKILRLRVFEDEQGKMNRSIQDIGGEILSVSQFTLFADVRKGNRPSFVGAGKPEHADIMWIKFNEALRSGGVAVREGRFGAHMRVGLVNDGPVTIVIDTADRH